MHSISLLRGTDAIASDALRHSAQRVLQCVGVHQVGKLTDFEQAFGAWLPTVAGPLPFETSIRAWPDEDCSDTVFVRLTSKEGNQVSFNVQASTGRVFSL